MKRNSYLLSLVLAAAVIASNPSAGLSQTPQQNSDARKLFLEGRDLQDDGKLTDAEKKFREALTKYPKAEQSDRTSFYLIATLVKLGRVADARTEIDNFRKNYPQSTWKSDVEEKSIALGGPRVITSIGALPLAAPGTYVVAEAARRTAQDRLDELRTHIVAPTPLPSPAPFSTFAYYDTLAYAPPLTGNASLASEALRLIIEKDGERGIEMAKDRLKVDPSDPVVVANFAAIANSNTAQAVPFFAAVSGSAASPNVKTQALFWMSRLSADKKDEVTKALMGMLAGAKDKETETGIVSAIERFNTVERQSVIDGIAQGQSPDRIALLEKLYRSSNNSSLRIQIIRAANQISDPRALALVTDAAQNDKDLSVRRNALQALGGRKDTDIKTFENILKSVPPSSSTPAK